jgi:dTDP-4-amino-4,6-dideoxygalactose transaminase
MIYVTKTFLPPLEEYTARLRGMWDRNQVTNNGPLVQELEARLREQFGVAHALFVSNGTIAIQLALHALGIGGEVITTPFSYVATTSSLLWERCTPVFTDIDPVTLCLDPARIEAAITPRTEAILATHVYGIPCDVEAIAAIAARHKLRVIYDAAHAFGVELGGQSLLRFGDVSTLSFHATKLFHTVEGGAIVTDDDALAHKLTLARSFGHLGDDHFQLGINGKSSEMHAAMGLTVLPHVPALVAGRRHVTELYDARLRGSALERPRIPAGVTYSYAYYPVLLPGEQALLDVRAALHEAGVQPRRYFYPSLNRLPYLQGAPCPVSESAALRALCLPLYPDLADADVHRICDVILAVLAR